MKKKNKLIVSLLCASVGAVSLSLAVANANVAFAEENEENTLTMKMTNMASIRYDNPTGIRFETTYSATDFSAYENYTFGTLVIPSDMLGEADLTHETANVQDIRKLVWYKDDATQKVMRSVLTEIPNNADAWGRELSARSYYFDGTSYTYSEITVERSIARTASLLLSQGNAKGQEDALNDYVDAVSKGLTASVESGTTFEMVVGGKETITATPNPANYGVVWTSSDPTVATVSNGVITAKANGETTVTVAFGTEFSYSYTVKVVDYVQRDGSDFVQASIESDKGYIANVYAKTEETIGGRTGVYKYTGTSNKDWTNNIALKEIFHYNSAQGEGRMEGWNNFKNKGYKYATFDILLEKGAVTNLEALATVSTYVSDRLTSTNANGSKNGTYAPANESIGDNANIKVYNLGSENEVSGISHATWYTVVIDYSQVVLQEYKAQTYCTIRLSGIIGTFYIDNIRYYANDSWKEDIKTYNQYDGSEFVQVSTNFTGSYGLATEADGSLSNIGGRTGVYKYYSDTAGWTNKMGIRQGNSYGQSMIYSSQTVVRENMSNLGYNYIAFDMYIENNGVDSGIIICVPDVNATNTEGQTNAQYYKTWSSNTTNGRIKIYSIDNEGNATLVEGNPKIHGAWYTVVVEYDHTATGAYAGIDFCSHKVGTVAYFDNVRYYNANPFA